jgi:hypothetical protein
LSSANIKIDIAGLRGGAGRGGVCCIARAYCPENRITRSKFAVFTLHRKTYLAQYFRLTRRNADPRLNEKPDAALEVTRARRRQTTT